MVIEFRSGTGGAGNASCFCCLVKFFRLYGWASMFVEYSSMPCHLGLIFDLSREFQPQICVETDSLDECVLHRGFERRQKPLSAGNPHLPVRWRGGGARMKDLCQFVDGEPSCYEREIRMEILTNDFVLIHGGRRLDVGSRLAVPEKLPRFGRRRAWD